jgi:hypothetical protein
MTILKIGISFPTIQAKAICEILKLLSTSKVSNLIGVATFESFLSLSSAKLCLNFLTVLKHGINALHSQRKLPKSVS